KIRDDELGNATEKFKSPDMGANPVLQTLAPGGFGVGEVAGPQHRHKQRSLPNGTTLRVVDRNRSPSKVDKELLTGLVLLTQHHVQALPPVLVQLAEAAVAVAFRVSLTVLLPGQLQGQMVMALKLVVKARE